MTACKKEKSTLPGLVGKWELRRKYGGFGYKDSTYAPGNNNIYQFNRDSTYKRLESGSLTEAGFFHIKKNGLRIGDSEYSDVILFNNGDGSPIALKDNKLTLGTTVTDGIAADYEKIP
jgi:hypothetical protein